MQGAWCQSEQVDYLEGGQWSLWCAWLVELGLSRGILGTGGRKRHLRVCSRGGCRFFFDAGDLFSGEEEGGIRIKSHLLFDSIVWSGPWGRGVLFDMEVSFT